MPKLFPWHRLRSCYVRSLPHLPASSRVFSRLLSRRSPAAEPEDDIHDPPFSPTQLKTRNQKNKLKTSSGKTAKVSDGTNLNTAKHLPAKSDLPFDFMYSYSENSPGVNPIGFREPQRFSPFGPGRLDRKWTGVRAPAKQKTDLEKFAAERARVLGEPLSDDEVAALVEKYRHSDCSRQINLGRGGVTHNALEDIHNHWKRAEAVRIKVLGVPTIDMDNVCFHLEDKSGGKIIHRQINILLLYRGRNYDPNARPHIPTMLWKPLAPIYPKLVKNVPDGLTYEEAKELRNRGLNSTPLMKLTRNGVYVNVVEKVRTAFRSEDVVRLDCAHVGTNDCKKIGVKLRDIVPCIPLLFKDEQIILWKGIRGDE
ncbi:CRS2-associated factor 2, mitochondrial isoform X2 [Andrographis paniculata]|uniref:CRS2-associated factor 2, mitochondrial isoform X2 n=1 Tax=Andrographis paniculata TaxID=175694 RepID=UPI0021E959DE|nr:CRS2-associated factor 2, mitochondrial isoform X2 [Andrographis paniculata]